MSRGFHMGGAGGSEKPNPVLFENGNYADGVSAINLLYASSAPNYDNARYEIDSGLIKFYGANGAGCCCKYLSFDLSKYAGKNLYFEYTYNGGARTTQGFSITSASKKVVFGVGTPYESGYKWHFAFGISNMEVPDYIVNNSDIVNSYTASPVAPLATISKIWIAG